jgi:hypothetical protein
MNAIDRDDFAASLELLFDIMLKEAADALEENKVDDEGQIVDGEVYPSERECLEDAVRSIKIRRRALLENICYIEANTPVRLFHPLLDVINAAHTIGMIGNAARSAMAHGNSIAQSARASGSREVEWHEEARKVAREKLRKDPEIKKSEIYRAIRRANIAGASDEDKTLSRVIGVLPEIAARKKNRH